MAKIVKYTFDENGKRSWTLEDEPVFRTINGIRIDDGGEGLEIGGSTFEGTLDDIADGITYVKTENNFTDAEKSKLEGIDDHTLPTTARSLSDDFVTQSTETGEVGALAWSFTNGSLVAANAEQNHPGIQTRRSGTTANQVASMYMGNAVGTQVFRFENFNTVYWVIALVSIADVKIRFGIFNNVSSNPPTDGLYIEYDPTVDGNFYGVSRAGSSQTKTASLGVTDTSWHTFRLRRIDASTVGFQIDGGTEVTLTANILAGTVGLNCGNQVIPTTTAAKDVKLDFFSLKLNAVTR